MGYIFSDAFTALSVNPPYLIPNTDPTRIQDQSSIFGGLVPGACPFSPLLAASALFSFVVKSTEFFLEPDLTIEEAEEIGNVSPFQPLKRLNP